MAEMNNKDWLSFDGLVHNVKNNDAHNGAANLLLSDDQLRGDIQKQLNDLKIPSLQYVGHGRDAIVAKISDRQVVRISSKIHVKPLRTDEVLQPVFSKTIKGKDNQGLRFEVLPYLGECEVTLDHKEALCINLSKRGFYFSDPKFHSIDHNDHNVRLLPDGTPIIIDRESASHTTDDPFVEMERDGWSQKPAPNYKWAGKQEAFFPEIVSGQIVSSHHVNSGDAKVFGADSHSAKLYGKAPGEPGKGIS